MSVKKRCPSCGLLKTEEGYHRNRSKKDGLSSYCILCKRKKRQQYYRDNREKFQAYLREYRKRNKKRIRETIRNYYRENRPALLAYYKGYRQGKRAYIRKYRQHRYNNPSSEKRLIQKSGRRRYYVFPGGRSVHVVIAEKILGRRFKKNECVHHIDGDGLNNHHDNLLICSRGYHCHLHSILRRKKKQHEVIQKIHPPKKILSRTIICQQV